MGEDTGAIMIRRRDEIGSRSHYFEEPTARRRRRRIPPPTSASVSAVEGSGTVTPAQLVSTRSSSATTFPGSTVALPCRKRKLAAALISLPAMAPTTVGAGG